MSPLVLASRFPILSFRGPMLPIAFALALTIGCQPASEAPIETVVETTEAPRIAWFEGTVEEAFSTAAAEDKPLFLYWGAVWCPPCHYLKDKIFTKPEFVAQSQKFVAVYLDGDTDRAQAWGEKLEISGYPTVLILNPQGEEVMRMSSGIPVEEYNGVLDAALAQMRPIDEILDSVLSRGVETADPSALALLANYSWGQDRSFELSTEERFQIFRKLYAGTPVEQRVTRSHFLALLLDDAAQLTADGESQEPALTADEIVSHRSAVLDLLQDEKLRRANPGFISFSAAETIDLLEPAVGESRDALAQAFLEAGAAIEADETMAMMDRLYAIYTRLSVAEMKLKDAGEVDEEGEVEWPAEELDHLRSRIDWANRTVTDEGELQGAMNVMAGLLDDVGIGGEAKTLIESRLDDTEAPHYYMGWLADLEEDAGDPEAALDWSRRSYEASEGPYTRFQWGSGYVRDLLRLNPDALDVVEDAAIEVLDELLANEDAFANRNLSRLDSLDESLEAWAADAPPRAAVESRIRAHVGESCEGFSGEGEDSPRARCLAFGQI